MLHDHLKIKLTRSIDRCRKLLARLYLPEHIRLTLRKISWRNVLNFNRSSLIHTRVSKRWLFRSGKDQNLRISSTLVLKLTMNNWAHCKWQYFPLHLNRLQCKNPSFGSEFHHRYLHLLLSTCVALPGSVIAGCWWC